MVCTTNISPITVMAVVDVVGVIPNTQTSAGLPVLRLHQTTFATGSTSCAQHPRNRRL